MCLVAPDYHEIIPRLLDQVGCRQVIEGFERHQSVIHRVLKLTRTIADLAGNIDIASHHLADRYSADQRNL